MKFLGRQNNASLKFFLERVTSLAVNEETYEEILFR